MADTEPLALLALTNLGPFKENREAVDFDLVTVDSIGGMVDIHDRRPVAVSAEDARRWLDPKLTTDETMHIARTATRCAANRTI